MPAYYTFVGSILLLAFGACSPPRFMYNPMAVNVPDFTRAGQGEATAAYSPHGLDIQGGYAFADHWAIQGNIYGRASNWTYDYRDGSTPGGDTKKVRYRRLLAGAAVAYFNRLDQRERFYWSLSAGYGRGSLHTWQRDKIAGPDAAVSFSSHHYRARTHRIMAQAALMWKWPYSRLLLSFRETAMAQTHQRSDFEAGVIGLEAGHLYYFGEPAVTFVLQPRKVSWMGIRLQLGSTIPPSDLTFDILPLIANIGLTFYPGKSRQ